MSGQNDYLYDEAMADLAALAIMEEPQKRQEAHEEMGLIQEPPEKRKSRIKALESYLEKYDQVLGLSVGNFNVEMTQRLRRLLDV